MQPLRYLNAAALNHVQSIFAYTTGYRVRQQRGCIFAGCTKSRPHGRCTARHGGAHSTTQLAAPKLGGVEGLARPTGARAAARRAANMSGGTWSTRRCPSPSLSLPRHLCPAHFWSPVHHSAWLHSQITIACGSVYQRLQLLWTVLPERPPNLVQPHVDVKLLQDVSAADRAFTDVAHGAWHLRRWDGRVKDARR